MGLIQADEDFFAKGLNEDLGKTKQLSPWEKTTDWASKIIAAGSAELFAEHIYMR